MEQALRLHFEVDLAPSTPADHKVWSERLARIAAHFSARVAPPELAKVRVVLRAQGRHFLERALAESGSEPRGVGCRDSGRAIVVLHCDTTTDARNATAHRLVVHEIVHVLLAHVAPHGTLPGAWGAFEEGLAHWFEAELCDGITERPCYLEHAQPPLLFRGGRWRSAAAELERAATLPGLEEVAGREISDLDPEQRVTAFAFVDWLANGNAITPTTGLASRPEDPLPRFVRAAKAGESLSVAMRKILGREPRELDGQLRAWLREAARSAK